MTDEPTLPSSATPPVRRRRAARTAPDSALPDVIAPPEVSTPAALAPAMPAAVEVLRGAVGGIRAQDVHVRSGVVGGIAGDHASVEMGFVGGMAAREASVSQGVVRSVLAQDVRIEQSIVRSVVANRVQVGPTTAIGFVLARRVDGDPKVLLDWRGALALAAVFGALAAMFHLRRR